MSGFFGHPGTCCSTRRVPQARAGASRRSGILHRSFAFVTFTFIMCSLDLAQPCGVSIRRPGPLPSVLLRSLRGPAAAAKRPGDRAAQRGAQGRGGGRRARKFADAFQGSLDVLFRVAHLQVASLSQRDDPLRLSVLIPSLDGRFPSLPCPPAAYNFEASSFAPRRAGQGAGGAGGDPVDPTGACPSANPPKAGALSLGRAL